MIALEDVELKYSNESIALRSLGFAAEKGEFIFVTGASGAGKSSLLKLLFASEKPTNGSVRVAGMDLGSLSPEGVAAYRQKVGFIFQDYHLLKRKTALENVALGLEVQAILRSEREQVALRMLEAVGLREKAESFPETLSGGEQQRVAIARGLLGRPQVLLADEPTGNLDSRMSDVVFNLLLEANAAGMTVIVATHDLRRIDEMKRRTLVLDRGKIISDYTKSKGQVA